LVSEKLGLIGEIGRQARSLFAYRLKVNNDNFKFNGDFKSHITVGKTLEKHLAFLVYFVPTLYLL
jgi:hypothetical protein